MLVGEAGGGVWVAGSVDSVCVCLCVCVCVCVCVCSSPRSHVYTINRHG